MLDFQSIEKQDGVFWSGTEQISADKIAALIASINQLHPVPVMLNSITHFDDYPIWSIELSDANGTTILLFSNSNTADRAPWNVIYNGQIFSQYEGSITGALADIFSPEQGFPIASTGTGNSPEGFIKVESVGWPNQLVSGFDGLMAVQSSFGYRVDSETGMVRGHMEGRSSVGGMGHMIIGSITVLETIEIEGDEGQVVACTIESVASDDPAALIWEFACPVAEPGATGAYRYPIAVTFATDSDNTYTVTGNLFGNWQAKTVIPQIKLPPDIATLLETQADYVDLSQDHQIMVTSFNALVEPGTGALLKSWSGDVVLLGQADTGDRVIPYSIMVRVVIEEGEIVQWDLNRSTLRLLLADVLAEAITERFLAFDPDLRLNLYYAE
ncbi:MAG: hypothetical protein KDE09_22760, partial [Anaerolineales bacterium]|nr:hypothetical protein [Anaerolineales bacterium]